MKKTGTAIILAGGQSSRMGFNKLFIKIGDSYLIDLIINELNTFFEEIIVVSNTKEIGRNSDVIVIEDELENIGPLGGLHIGLKNSKSMYSYVIACDMPYINHEYIKYMSKVLIQSKEVHALVTKFGEWIEPFNSFYYKGMVKHIEEHIKCGERSIYTLVERLNISYIEEKIARRFSPDWDMFVNLNTEADLKLHSSSLKKFYKA